MKLHQQQPTIRSKTPHYLLNRTVLESYLLLSICCTLYASLNLGKNRHEGAPLAGMQTKWKHKSFCTASESHFGPPAFHDTACFASVQSTRGCGIAINSPKDRVPSSYTHISLHRASRMLLVSSMQRAIFAHEALSQYIRILKSVPREGSLYQSIVML